MTAAIITFPVDRCRPVQTVDQLVKAQFKACRDIFALASAEHLERPGDGGAIAPMLLLACEGECPSTRSHAARWLFINCNVKVTA